MTNRQTLAKMVVTQKTHLQLWLLALFPRVIQGRTVPETEIYPATMGPKAGPAKGARAKKARSCQRAF